MSAGTGKPLAVFAPAGEQPDAKALAQIEMVMRDDRAVAGALCADHHLGYSMPIGGVVAYEAAISPSGVGYDIGCGNKAVLTNLYADDLQASLSQVMDEIASRISFGIGRANARPVDHDLFGRHADVLRELDQLAGPRAKLTQKARAQLGTVGAGNHYVDLLVDNADCVWIACHFGSRGLGHTIATGFLNLAADKQFDDRGRERDEPTVIASTSELGARYLAAMELAGDYAYAGRDIVVDEVLSILGARAVGAVHNHHNYAWFENGLWVVRKGATPLTRDPAFIGGSMGEGAAIVRGHALPVDGEAVVDIGAINSAPHGAGRVMSRTKAAGKRRRSSRYGCPVRECELFLTPQQHDLALREVADRTDGVACQAHPDRRLRKFTHFEHLRDGVVDWPVVQEGLRARGIELRGAAADEAPEVYKNLADVLDAHENVEVLEWLRPLGVVMAGADVFDPYKD